MENNVTSTLTDKEKEQIARTAALVRKPLPIPKAMSYELLTIIALQIILIIVVVSK